MCKTEGTDWEATAMMHISLKLEAWKAIQRVRDVIANVPENRKTLGIRALIANIEKALDGEQG